MLLMATVKVKAYWQSIPFLENRLSCSLLQAEIPVAYRKQTYKTQL